MIQSELIQTDNLFITGVNASLTASCGFFNSHLRQTSFDSFCHTTQLLNFLNKGPAATNQLLSQSFYIVGAAPRIDNFANFGFILDVQLSVTSNTSGEISRQSNSFVQSVGVQRLGVTQSCAHSFNTSTSYVVERILFGQRPTGRLAVSTQSQRFRILRTKGINNLSPQSTSCTHFSHFHEVVLADCPEERQTRSKCVNSQASFNTGTDIIPAVSQSVSHFNIIGSTSFLHMIAGNRNAVKLRHILRCESENIADNSHRRRRGINISVTNHELFQNIVLDSTSQNLLRNTLLFSSQNIESQNRQNSAVHGHRYGHLIQRNAREQDFHIQNGVYSNTGFANVAYNTLVIGVITTVGCQVKSNGQAFLTSSQVTTIESVGFLSSREASVLTNCPRTNNIHCGIGTTQVRSNTSHKFDLVAICIILFSVQGFYINLFHCAVAQFLNSFACLCFNLLFPSIIACSGH